MARVNFNNPFRKKSKIKDDYLYEANPDGTFDYNKYANSFNASPGKKAIDPNAIMGQLGKFYEEYGPSMEYMGRNPGTRGIVEAGLDYGMRQVPGYGQAYGAIQDFNRMTGGINVGKAFGLKQDPFKALGNRIFGDPNKNQMTPAQMAILGRNATRSAALENAANADIASARMERDRLGPQQRNVMDLLSDLANNPQSSRDLAATTGAGLAPIQELIAKRTADTKASIARRGLSGGMATGLLEGTRQSGDAATADLINKTTLAAMERRPQMINALAGVVGQEQARMDARDAAARGVIGQIDEMDFRREMEKERMGLERDRLAAAERASTLEGIGGVLGQFGPDIVKELQRLRTRGTDVKPTTASPLVTADTLDSNTINPDNFTFNIPPNADTSLTEGLGMEGTTNELPIQRLPSIPPTAEMRELPVESTTQTVLNLRYPNPQVGDITPPDARGIRFKYTAQGWKKLQAKSSAKFGPFASNFGLGG
jgi:hypothetical protein